MTAVACGWLAAEWAVRLLTLLLGEAQTTGKLPGGEESCSGQDGFSLEDHRYRYRSIQLGSAGRPFMLAQQLKDAATRWLQMGERMLEKVVLEQFVEGPPVGTLEWVWYH